MIADISSKDPFSKNYKKLKTTFSQSLPGGFATRTRIHQMGNKQRTLSKNQNTKSKVPESVKLERNLEKDKFDIQMMSTIRLISDASEKGILVVFLTSATGNFNCDARRLTGLQSRIPPQIMDPKMTFFKPIQDHFKLLDLGLTNPRYMDYLKEGVPYMFGTMKPHNGDSGIIPRKEKAAPSSMATTSAQRNLYIQKSQNNDIVSNTIDIICYRKDEVTPSVNYVMVLEGNPKVTSAITMFRNMIPSPPDRLLVDEEGQTEIDPTTNRHRTHPAGGHADHWPFREDNTLLLEQVGPKM